MLNSISSSMAYTNQEAMKVKGNQPQKTQDIDNKSDIKSNLSPKAAAIAEQIANGSYKVDLKATASAIADELF